jgi:hypothetical protein
MAKYFLLTYCYLAFVFTGFSQGTFYEFIPLDFPQVRFTGVISTDSCYYVTGDFVDTITPTRVGIHFAKLDLDGEVLFYKTIKHPNRIYASFSNDFVRSLDGNFIDACSWGDSITRANVFKYSPQGDTLLVKEVYNLTYPLNYYITATGGVVHGTNGKSAIGLTHDAGNSSDVSLLVIDSLFNTVFYKAYGVSNFSDVSHSVALDDDGGYIVGAERYIPGTISNYVNRTYIFKTDSLGGLLWEYLSPQGELWDKAATVLKAPDGGLVVASGIGEEVQVNPNGLAYIFWDPVIFKLDTAQNLEWSTLLRSGVSSPLNEIVDMVNTNEGDLVILGNTGRDNPPLEYGRGVTIAKISSTGDSLWARYYILLGGVDYDIRPYDLDNTSDGGFILAGVDASNVTTTIPGWIMKVDEYGCLIPGCHLIDDTTTVTGNKIMPISKLVIYPNPAIDFLNFQLQNPAVVQGAFFRVLDMEGRLVREYGQLDVSAVFSIPVRGWPMGVYFLQYWENGDLKQSERFVVGK